LRALRNAKGRITAIEIYVKVVQMGISNFFRMSLNITLTSITKLLDATYTHQTRRVMV